MRINVHLHTVLQRQVPGGARPSLEMELPEGASISDLIAALPFAADPHNLLLVVNGRTANLDHVLQPDDQVDLIPAISGG